MQLSFSTWYLLPFKTWTCLTLSATSLWVVVTKEKKGDVRALPMKKWFNTNYHYIVPKFEKDTQVKLAGHKIFDEFQEAKELGLNTRPVLVGPFTFLQLSDFEEGVKAEDFVDSLVAAYQEVFAKLAELGATRIQLDEAALVKDLTAEEKALFLNLYNKLLADKKGLEVLLQTYFGDVRDVYADLVNLPVDAIGLDFVEGKKLLNSLKVASQLTRHFMQVLSMVKTSGATTMKRAWLFLNKSQLKTLS